jgi:undecaprenyl-diphosphatase
MENFVSALIMAVVQGLTEWLPVSSSGHLALLDKLFNYQGGLMFDVALHFGTLMAVFVYFGKDIIDIIEDVLKWKTRSPNFRLGLLLIVASIPAAIVGYVFEEYFEIAFGSLGIVALGFGITGLFLLIASLDFGRLKKKKENLSYMQSFLIGIAQAVAIFPGISRSGATISAGLLTGLNEKDAVKFSFLMSIPAVFGANLVAIGNNTLPRELIWATLLAFIVGLAGIHFMLKIIADSRKNLRWFGIYCLLLALALGIYLLFS